MFISKSESRDLLKRQTTAQNIFKSVTQHEPDPHVKREMLCV